LDFCLVWIPATFAILWIVQALFDLYITKMWIGATNLFLFSNVHTITVLAVCPLYLYFFTNNKRNLSIPIRVVTAITVVSIGIFFNGFIWSLLNLYLGSGTGSITMLIHLISVSFISVILYNLNIKYGVIQIYHKFMLVTTILFLISLAVFINSGFFQNWALYEKGLILDPHNWQWVLEKTVAVYMWIGVTKT